MKVDKNEKKSSTWSVCSGIVASASGELDGTGVCLYSRHIFCAYCTALSQSEDDDDWFVITVLHDVILLVQD